MKSTNRSFLQYLLFSLVESTFSARTFDYSKLTMFIECHKPPEFRCFGTRQYQKDWKSIEPGKTTFEIASVLYYMYTSGPELKSSKIAKLGQNGHWISNEGEYSEHAGACFSFSVRENVYWSTPLFNLQSVIFTNCVLNSKIGKRTATEGTFGQRPGHFCLFGCALVVAVEFEMCIYRSH